MTDNYECKHCNYNLDAGDIYEVLKSDKDKYLNGTGNYLESDILNSAKYYGWSYDNKKHFTIVLSIKYKDGTSIKVCPNCRGTYPLDNR